jgi:hypothetical protein
MLVRWLLYAALTFIVVRIVQATLRIIHDGSESRGEDPLRSAPPPPPVRDDFKDAKDADFVELPPEEKKGDAGV